MILIVLTKSGFGMSEIGWGTLVPSSQAKKLVNCMTVGKVCPNVEMKVIDENEDSLPANMRGQICIRSRQVWYENI